MMVPGARHGDQRAPTAPRIAFAAPLARIELGVSAEAARATRLLMQRLRREGAAFLGRAVAIPESLIADVCHKRGVGRDRALARVDAVVGCRPLVRNERVFVWRYLVGLAHPLLAPGADDAAAGGRDAIQVRYLAIGRLARGLARDESGWTFSATDHAIGRLIERAPGVDPEAAVLAAHDAVCGLHSGGIGRMLDAGTWPIPTQGGAFLATVQPALEEWREGFGLSVVADTFVAHDMLRMDQERELLLFAGCTPRYLDGPLCPAALREPITLGEL